MKQMGDFFISGDELKNMKPSMGKSEISPNFFLNLKHVNSNNPKVKVTCCNIINQAYSIFPLNN